MCHLLSQLCAFREPTGRLDKATRTSVSSAACKTEGNKIHDVTLNVVVVFLSPR